MVKVKGKMGRRKKVRETNFKALPPPFLLLILFIEQALDSTIYYSKLYTSLSFLGIKFSSSLSSSSWRRAGRVTEIHLRRPRGPAAPHNHNHFLRGFVTPGARVYEGRWSGGRGGALLDCLGCSYLYSRNITTLSVRFYTNHFILSVSYVNFEV